MKSQDLDSKLEEVKSPFVAVWMVTYNHESYIVQAIESILMQQTNFDFKVFIGDDCSTDNTTKICQEYKGKYPDKIELFLHERNIGATSNGIFMYEHCFKSGAKYIALCEGDDYWTDPLKLQKQVDFLEGNPDYVICFHKVKVLRNGILEEDSITPKVPETTTIKELATGNYIHTCSAIFKNNLFDSFPDYFQKTPVGDYFLHMLNARYGKIKFLNEFLAIYRLHNNSLWSSQEQTKRVKVWIDFLNNIKLNFDIEVQKIIENQIKEYTGLQMKTKKSIFKRAIKKLFNLLK